MKDTAHGGKLEIFVRVILRSSMTNFSTTFTVSSLMDVVGRPLLLSASLEVAMPLLNCCFGVGLLAIHQHQVVVDLIAVKALFREKLDHCSVFDFGA